MPHPVLVLAGGLSHERDVSLRSGRRVTMALRDAGHEVVEADVTAGLIDQIRAIPDVVVFPLVHGGVGEDGALREVFSLLGVPYVGSSGPSCRVAWDKSIATPVVRKAGGRVPKQVALPHDIFRELGAAKLVSAVVDQLGLPVVVKPASGGSSLGVTKVDDAADLPAAMVGAYSYGEAAVIEEFVAGTEVAITVIDTADGPHCLPTVEILPDSGTYDFAARYTAGDTRFIVPAQIDHDSDHACQELALLAVKALGLRGMSRIDMIISPDGPTFLEANVAPGMTETSLAPLAMIAAGYDQGEVCSTLVELAATAE